MSRYISMLHRVIGVFMVIHLSVFLGSGVLLLYQDEMALWLKPDETKAPLILKPSRMKSVLAQALAQNKGTQPVLVMRKANDLIVRLNVSPNRSLKGSSRQSYSINPDKPSPNGEADIFKRILELHRDFGMGNAGKRYMTYVSYLFLVLILSGLLVSSPSLWLGSLRNLQKRKFSRLGTYRWHMFLGLILAPWLLLMGITGSALYWKKDLVSSFRDQVLSKASQNISEGKANISAWEALERAQNMAHGMELYFLAFPGSEYGGPNHYGVVFRNMNARPLEKLVMVNQFDGTILSPNLPLHLELVFEAFLIHSGLYGSWFGKALWTLGSLISFILIYTGLCLTLSRLVKIPRWRRTRFKKGHVAS